MVPTRWSRGDQRALEAVLWAGLALGAMGLAVRVVQALGGRPVRVSAELPDRLVAPPALVEGPLTGTVVLENPSGGQLLLALLPVLVVAALVAAGGALLLGVVRSLGRGDTFTPRNARRLSWLALLVSGGGVGAQLVADATRNALLSRAGVLGSDLGLTFTLPLWPLGVGLALALLAEVFARGSLLRDEVEGLV